MNYFEQQMRRIFGESTVLSANTVFTNQTMIAEIGKDIRAKVDFFTFAIANHYYGLKLSIINRTGGVIDVQLFKFSDIIGCKENVFPHIWVDSGTPKWYCYTPTSEEFRKIQTEVEQYMLMYADQAMRNDEGQMMGGM